MLAARNAEVAVTLPSDREIAFSRLFRRGRELLFDAWTKPEHIRHWWGCDGSSVLVCDIDLRIGGDWHIVGRMPPGIDQSFSGVYADIKQNERLVYTERYDAPQFGNPQWKTTVIFEKVSGGARLTHTILHVSKEARDTHLRVGMEAGETQSLRRLDQHIAQMAG